MAKIDLKKSAGFTLFIENGELVMQDLQATGHVIAHLDDLRSQLLNDEISTPDQFYKKYKNLDSEQLIESKGLKLNAYFIPPNLAGIEYIKTKASLAPSKPRILEVVYGSGIVLMQKGSGDSHDVILSRVKRDQKIIVPPKYSCVIINTKGTNLVVFELIEKEAVIKNVLDEMRGMAYYVIRKNAKSEVVRNPVYRTVDDYRKVQWDPILRKYNITQKTPILKQVLRKYEKFSWLFEEAPTQI